MSAETDVMITPVERDDRKTKDVYKILMMIIMLLLLVRCYCLVRIHSNKRLGKQSHHRARCNRTTKQEGSR